MGKFFSFDWSTNPKSEAKSEYVDTPSGNGPSSTAGVAAVEASAHIEEVRKKRKYTKRDEVDDSQRAAIREELTAEFAQLFNPAVWEGIVRGPADLMLHVTGRELWDIPEKELKPLALGAAHSARLFLRTDPKWMALFMFSVSLSQVYGGRIAVHIAQTRKEAKEREEIAARAMHSKPV